MTRPSPLHALGEHVAREEEPLVDDEMEHQRLRAALLVRAPLELGRSRRAFTWVAGVAAAAALLGSVWFWRRSPERPLRFFVGPEHVQGTLGEFVSAVDAPVPVTFSDGTKIVFESEARGRVLSTGARGADVVIESGRAHVSVVPRSGNRWIVSTGPFAVQVTGTRFDVEWHPDRDAFVLELQEGHVRVSGCAFAGGHAVNAGERVEASCKEGAFRVSRLDEMRSAPAASAPEVGPAPSSVERDEPPVAQRPAPPAHGLPVEQAETSGDWRGLARQGRFADGYRLAAPRFEDLCERGPAEDLVLLGDAARLSGHAAEARRAYQRVRDRFAGTSAAALGAFQIGRLDFDQRADYQAAERWLLAYLGEQPTGTFAPAAMGRLIEAEVHLGRLPRAQRYARQYLEQFPKGPHAETARRVLSARSEPP